VFGSDGRLRLYNPVVRAHCWAALARDAVDAAHIEAVSGASQPLHGDHPVWLQLRATVTAIENREPVNGRIERLDGNVVDCATMPLPDGATLVTFQDRHRHRQRRARAARAQRSAGDRGQAQDRFPCTTFSYELRSPLTNIIGFAHFLGDPVTGPLAEKQREYLSYITVSTNALLAIINNILDLATIDAGAMTLNLGAVDTARPWRPRPRGCRTAW